MAGYVMRLEGGRGGSGGVEEFRAVGAAGAGLVVGMWLQPAVQFFPSDFVGPPVAEAVSARYPVPHRCRIGFGPAGSFGKALPQADA